MRNLKDTKTDLRRIISQGDNYINDQNEVNTVLATAVYHLLETDNDVIKQDKELLLNELKLQVKYIKQITQNDAIENIHNCEELIKKLRAII